MQTENTGSPEELLTAQDLSSALELSTEAGWNQTLADWQRLLTLSPHSCFCLKQDGKVVSTTVATVYEKKLAWIGMVLTRKDYRGKGFASQLLKHTLNYLDERGVECVKLDATDLGRPVYAKAGFVEERPVSRWLRRVAPISRPQPTAEMWMDADMRALDRRAFGVSRTALLEDLAKEEAFSLRGQGYVLVRPGRSATHVGPCVAETLGAAQSLMVGVIRSHSRVNLIWDLCDEHEDAASLAMELGFVRSRKLMRMRRGGNEASVKLATGKAIYALAGFEFG